MARESNGLEATGTFVSGWQPVEANVISAQWIFTRKSDESGRVVMPKATLVARGFSQRKGIDLYGTYAPTLSMISFVCGLRLRVGMIWNCVMLMLSS